MTQTNIHKFNRWGEVSIGEREAAASGVGERLEACGFMETKTGKYSKKEGMFNLFKSCKGLKKKESREMLLASARGRLAKQSI